MFVEFLSYSNFSHHWNPKPRIPSRGKVWSVSRYNKIVSSQWNELFCCISCIINNNIWDSHNVIAYRYKNLALVKVVVVACRLGFVWPDYHHHCCCCCCATFTKSSHPCRYFDKTFKSLYM